MHATTSAFVATTVRTSRFDIARMSSTATTFAGSAMARTRRPSSSKRIGMQL
jgi:hypothetical protein